MKRCLSRSRETCLRRRKSTGRMPCVRVLWPGRAGIDGFHRPPEDLGYPFLPVKSWLIYSYGAVALDFTSCAKVLALLYIFMRGCESFSFCVRCEKRTHC